LKNRVKQYFRIKEKVGPEKVIYEEFLPGGKINLIRRYSFLLAMTCLIIIPNMAIKQMSADFP
jgi:hypothetical protein